MKGIVVNRHHETVGLSVGAVVHLDRILNGLTPLGALGQRHDGRKIVAVSDAVLLNVLVAHVPRGDLGVDRLYLLGRKARPSPDAIPIGNAGLYVKGFTQTGCAFRGGAFRLFDIRIERSLVSIRFHLKERVADQLRNRIQTFVLGVERIIARLEVRHGLLVAVESPSVDRQGIGGFICSVAERREIV